MLGLVVLGIRVILSLLGLLLLGYRLELLLAIICGEVFWPVMLDCSWYSCSLLLESIYLFKRSSASRFFFDWGWEGFGELD